MNLACNLYSPLIVLSVYLSFIFGPFTLVRRLRGRPPIKNLITASNGIEQQVVLRSTIAKLEKRTPGEWLGGRTKIAISVIALSEVLRRRFDRPPTLKLHSKRDALIMTHIWVIVVAVNSTDGISLVSCEFLFLCYLGTITTGVAISGDKVAVKEIYK